MALDRRIAHPRQVVSVGQEVEVTVLAVEPTQRRISLSMVEHARPTRRRAAARAPRDRVAVAKANEPRGLGTFGDLLARSTAKRPPRG